MKKLLLVACVASFLIGCGGGGSTTGGGPGGGGPSGRTYPTFNLGSGALVQNVFLSGQGRTLPRNSRATSQIAVVRNVRYQNDVFDFIPTADNNVIQEMRVDLAGYNINAQSFGVQFPVGSSAVQYNQYALEIQHFLQNNGDGTTSDIPGQPLNQVSLAAPTPLDADVRIFPGRVSSMTIRLDDTMVGWNSGAGTPIYNEANFKTANYNPIYNKMISQFSDYVCFDISNVASKPQLHVDNGNADRVFFSGDGYGMSHGLGSTSQFELLDPINVLNGKVTTGPPIGPAGSQISGANLFILDDTGPALTRQTSIIGTWKNFSAAINETDTTTGVVFPSSREGNTIANGARQQFVLYKTSGGQVTDLWYGSVFYHVGGNPNNNIFHLYPVNTIDDAVPANEVSGTISNLVIVNGTVRRGDWDVVGVPNGLWPFGSNGGFGVYRR